MAAGMDEYYARQKEYNFDVDRQLEKKDKTRKRLIEQQRLKKEDLSEEEHLNHDDIREEGEEDVKPIKKKVTVKFDSDVENDEEDEDSDGGLFVNPLLINQKAK